jgi:omega-6 fatty acid desaturase (delta-12 desaturase)
MANCVDVTNIDVTNMDTTNDISEAELFMKYKSSYRLASIDFSIHILNSISAFYLMWYFKHNILSVFTIPLVSLMGIRTFVIFHDCLHESYTPNKILNYIISQMTGTIIMTNSNWIIGHNIHHLTNGKIGNDYKYAFNETILITKKHFLSLSPLYKKLFIFIKTPFIFFVVVPYFYFLFIHRFVSIIEKCIHSYYSHKSLLKVMFNLTINNVLLYIFLYKLYEYQILYHYLVSFLFITTTAFSVIHNQHTFEPPYVKNKSWTQRDSGLKGSSFIQIPWILKYFFMGIEYHHIHHMNSKLPGYNLQKYHEEVALKSDMFDNIVKLSLIDCYNNLWLSLYDEDEEKYITFDEMKYDEMKYDEMKYYEIKDKDV